MKKRIIALCAAILLCLTACQKDAPSNVQEGEKAKLQKVSLILDYVPNTNHTGFYVAREKGYFAEEGLELAIIEPADGTVSTLLSAGKGDFGISYQEDVTYALTAKEPLPIRAIAAIIQHNTSGFASFADKNIQSPADFEGKVYSGWGAPSEEAVLRAVMTAAGKNPETLTVVTSDGSGFGALRDKVDLMWFFWAWDGIASQRDGVPIHYIELRTLDERLDYYTPVIIATNDTLENKAELTRKFMRATSRGYAYSIENPEESAKILAAHLPEYDVEMLIESQTYLAGKYQDDAARWGEMRESVWANYTAFMVENGLIEQSIAPADCFTNDFLPE